MYSHVLGRTFNYGQSMIPGKSKKSKNKENVKKAVLAKRKNRG